MDKKYLPAFLLVLLLMLSFSVANTADAATLLLVPDKKSIQIGEEVIVHIVIDTDGKSINAAQGVVTFPVGMLEVMKVETISSVFTFWIEGPVFSNTEGIVAFIGGTSKGVAGKSLEALKLNVRARGAGIAEIGLSDAVITASDGKGSNILSSIGAATIAIGSGTIPSSPPVVTQPTAPVAAVKPLVPVVVQPKPVVRPAVPAKKKPITPVVTVPFYPDSTAWYNYLGETIALWKVPDDITAVATLLNQNPNDVPTITEKELVTGKNFGTVTEGIWYIHTRFKNNIGWGETAHYSISLDTTPPLPFEVTIDNAASDDPSPEIKFDARDAFSGISHALIFIDGQEVGQTTATTTAVELPAQGPGEHTVLVKIFDRGGSSVEDDLAFEVLPLPAPTIEFITRSISQSELMFASGRAIPNGYIDAHVFDVTQQEVFKRTTKSDNSGNWKITVDEALPTGKYTFITFARDERGALSNATDAEWFRVRPKTILSFGRFIYLGWFEIFIISALLVVSIAGIFAWWYVSKKNTRDAYRVILGRDIEKIATTLSGYVKEIEEQGKLPPSSRTASVAVFTKKMKETILKMKKYIIENEINKLK